MMMQLRPADAVQLKGRLTAAFVLRKVNQSRHKIQGLAHWSPAKENISCVQAIRLPARRYPRSDL